VKSDILNFFSEIHAEGIHAKGRLGTNVLLSNLDLSPKDKLLELGCGTGATLLKISRVFSDASLFGIDLSSSMVEKAKQRLRFCGVNSIEIKHAKEEKIPYPDASFNIIVVESVLAIQEGESLRSTLLECKRVLKPNGKIIFNETIWLDQTNKETIEEINLACKKNFGIIQANQHYPYLSDWIELLGSIGFKTKKIIKGSTFNKEMVSVKPYQFRSYLFSKTGSLKKYLKLGVYKEWKDYQGRMKEILNYNVPLMEGIIISAKLINE